MLRISIRSVIHSLGPGFLQQEETKGRSQAENRARFFHYFLRKPWASPWCFPRYVQGAIVLLFSNIYLAASGLSCIMCGTQPPEHTGSQAQLLCSMLDLSSLARDWICTPCIARWILNHWTTREVPNPPFVFKRQMQSWHSVSHRTGLLLWLEGSCVWERPLSPPCRRQVRAIYPAHHSSHPAQMFNLKHSLQKRGASPLQRLLQRRENSRNRVCSVTSSPNSLFLKKFKSSVEST